MSESPSFLPLKPKADDQTGALDTPKIVLSCIDQVSGDAKLAIFLEALEEANETKLSRVLVSSKSLNSFSFRRIRSFPVSF